MRRWLLMTVGVLGGCSGLRGYDGAVFACEADGACADGFFCVLGRCAPPGPQGAACEAERHCDEGLVCDRGACRAPGRDGSSCAASGDCASGVCAGGVCCAGRCEGPCATCETGTCDHLPAGARGGCTDFACSGESAWCGSTCTGETVASACVGGHLCRAAQCVACVGALRDDFRASSSAWNTFGSGSVDFGDGGLALQVEASGAPASVTLSAVTARPFEGCSFSVDVAEPGNLGGGFFTTVYARGTADGAHLGFLLDGQGLRAVCRYTSGQACPIHGRVFRSSATAYPRLRVTLQGETAEWWGVAPGEVEVSLGQETGLVLTSDLRLELSAGTEGASGGTVARVAGVNLDRR